MHARPIAVAVLLAFAPVAFTAPLARAQAAADDETTKAARARFQEGVDYYDKGQYEKARAAFLQAYALRKHPAVLLNLAQSCLKSGHQLEAVRYFQQFLKESTSISAAQRTDAEKGLAEGRQKLGRLEVSAPTGAEISVDNTTVGTAPLADPVDVEPGSHTVRMKASDGTADTKNVSASAGEKVKVQFTSGGGGAAVAPVPATTPSTTPSTTPPSSSETPPASSATPPAQDNTAAINANTANADTGTGGKSILSPPKTFVPVIIGGVLVVVGVVGAVAFNAQKQNALDNGRKVAADITAHGGNSKTCSTTPTPTIFVDACKSLNDNVNTANTDNTLANVGIGVAIGGAVLAIGWYLFAPKREDESTTKPPDVSFAPMLGGPREGNGMAFVKRF